MLFHSQVTSEIIDDAQKALGLLVQLSCCFSGKQADQSVVLSPGYEKKEMKNLVQQLVPGDSCTRFLLEKIFLKQFGLTS